MHAYGGHGSILRERSRTSVDSTAFLRRFPYVPQPPASRCTLGDPILWYFVRTLYIAYIILILLARLKWTAAKSVRYEIKIGIGTNPCRTSTAVDPAKHDAKPPRIESIFERRISGPQRAPDRISLFGNGRRPLHTLTPTLSSLLRVTVM